MRACPRPQSTAHWPSVDARLGDLEPRVVVVARHRLELAAEFRHPPRVHDVGGDDVERDGRVRSARPSPRRSRARRARRVRSRPGRRTARCTGARSRGCRALCRSAAACAWCSRTGSWSPSARAVVAFGPGVGRVLDRGQLREGDDRQRDQDHRRGDRPADLQARVAADLRRLRVPLRQRKLISA